MIANTYSERQRVRTAATKSYCNRTEPPFHLGERVYSSMWTAANPKRREFEVTRVTRRSITLRDCANGEEIHAHAGFAYNHNTGDIEEHWQFRLWEFQHEVHKV